MDKLIKKMENLDELLSKIEVRGDSVMTMATARMTLKDIYTSANSLKVELENLRYHKNAEEKESVDG